jgi:GcrA cell cycle regulator
MSFSWTPDNTEILKSMLSESTPLPEIASKLGTTTSSVEHKARRLRKTERSPSKETKSRRVSPMARSERRGCSWPIGHPGDKDFHFCGAKAVVGRPYCDEHLGIAFVKSKPLRIRA